MSERYVCEKFVSNVRNVEQIADFTIDRESSVANIEDKVIGLEAYLKRLAWEDDINGEVKIYLIKDIILDKVAAYFGLKAGMVVNNEYGIPSEEDKAEVLKEFNAKLVTAVTPGIELSHFAINDNYRRLAGTPTNPIMGLGAYFYPKFIYPIINDVAEKIGVKMIYLYAAGDDRLVRYYEDVLGFIQSNIEDFYMPLQPGYDGGCKFMYQILE